MRRKKNSQPVDPRQDSRQGALARTQALVLLEQISSERAKGSSATVKMGGLVDQLRQVLGLSPEEFAKRAGVSLSTFNRWRAGLLPPVHRIKSFVNLVHPEPASQHSVLSDGKRMTLRPLDQILDRQQLSTKSWSLKGQLPFRAGRPGEVQQRILDLLSDSTAVVEFNCVFNGPKGPATPATHHEHPGLYSFAEAKLALIQENPELASRFRGWRTLSSDASFSLGLCNWPLGVTILFYDREKLKAEKPELNREYDIFYEIPVAVYDPDEHRKLLNIDEVRWVELAPHLATLHLRDGGLRRKLENISNYAEEFLPTAQDVRAFFAGL